MLGYQITCRRTSGGPLSIRAWVGVLIAAFFFSGAAESAGFDCAKGSTVVEKIICADESLVQADETVSDLYNLLLKNTFNPALLKQEQAYWLKNQRNKCDNPECVRQAYRRRHDQLIRWRRYTKIWDGTFAHIEFYEDAPPTDLLSDKTLGKKVREAVGNKYPLLETNLSTSSGSKIGRGEYLVADGCAPHACSVSEARMVIGRLGQVYVAILDKNRVFYFTNDVSRADRPPELISDFIGSRNAVMKPRLSK